MEITTPVQSRIDEKLIQKQAISAKRSSEAYKENMKNYFPEKFCHGATPTLHEFSKRFKNNQNPGGNYLMKMIS